MLFYGKRHACHIACEETLPEFVQNGLSKELPEEFCNGTQNCIQNYDTSYVEALARFDRISKRLLEIQESCKLRNKRK